MTALFVVSSGMLAKYFSRRHIEIRNVRHIIWFGVALGILMSMRRHRRAAHRDIIKNEFVGI